MYACPLLCLTLCDPMDYSPPGSSDHGISQARILEWVAISSSRGSSQPWDRTHISCIGRQILYHCATWETQVPCISFILVKRKMWKDPGLPLNLVEHSWLLVGRYIALIVATLYFSFAGSLVSFGVKFKVFIAFFYSFSFWDLLLPSKEKLF